MDELAARGPMTPCGSFAAVGSDFRGSARARAGPAASQRSRIRRAGVCVCIDDSRRWLYPVRWRAGSPPASAPGGGTLGGRSFSPPLWAGRLRHGTATTGVDGREHRLLPPGCFVGQRVRGARRGGSTRPTGSNSRRLGHAMRHRKRLKEWRSHRAERRERARVGGNDRWKFVL